MLEAVTPGEYRSAPCFIVASLIAGLSAIRPPAGLRITRRGFYTPFSPTALGTVIVHHCVKFLRRNTKRLNEDSVISLSLCFRRSFPSGSWAHLLECLAELLRCHSQISCNQFDRTARIIGHHFRSAGTPEGRLPFPRTGLTPGSAFLPAIAGPGRSRSLRRLVDFLRRTGGNDQGG